MRSKLLGVCFCESSKEPIHEKSGKLLQTSKKFLIPSASFLFLIAKVDLSAVRN